GTPPAGPARPYGGRANDPGGQFCMACGKPRGKFTGRKAAEASPGGGGGSGGETAAGTTSLSGTRVVARTAVTREQGESISCPFCAGRARGLQPFCPHCGR